MKPTDILTDEHRIIAQVLECLGRIVERAECDRMLNRRSAREAVSFLRIFADRWHHAKEEDHLFPTMEARGFSREGGPTGVMIYEHEQTRRRIRKMDENVEAASLGDRIALRKFVQHARAYCNLLRNHIEIENTCLYAMANQALTDEDQRELLLVFQKVEAEEPETGLHEQYVSIANNLANRLDVPHATAALAEQKTGRLHQRIY